MDIFKLKTGQNSEPVDEAKLAEDFEFLEGVLKQEDPEFMKSVEGIHIENSDVHASLADGSLIVHSRRPSLNGYFESPVLKLFLKPFMIHRYPKQVIGFWVIAATVFYGISTLNKSKIWTAKPKLFLTSYAELGVTVHGYDMLSNMEWFYDNVRFPRNLLSLVKMTTNIKPSDNSSNNPMISFEVVLQGVSNEPIVEIKDREAEFRDLVLRVAEEYSYDDLDTADGKQRMSEAMLAKINANLTAGQVRRVLYKNFILKP
jgi:hypothetical protein